MRKTPEKSTIVDTEVGPVAPKKLRFIEIRWLDAVVGDSWAPLHGENDVIVSECITRGWLVKEDERQVIVCATLGTNADGLVEDVNTVIAIPKGMVTDMTDFPLRRTRKPKADPNG